MKRFCFFLALMVLSSSAHAGDSYSFVIAGHRIRIEAPRHCRSASCVSISIPGIYHSNRARDRDDEVATAPQAAPVATNPPAPTAAPAAPAVTRASPPVVQPVASQPVAAQPVASVAPPPPPAPLPPPAPATAPAPQLSSTTAKIVVLPPPPPPVPAAPVSTTQTIAPPPLSKVEPAKTTEPPPAVVPKPIPVPVPMPVPPIAKISQQTENAPADAPLGDWQTEGNKGTVRIERCGEAMCGYLINLTADTRGDTVLINMKPKSGTKSDAVWSGNIYSRSSGHTYYSTMTMKGVNTLRVEACALGRFFCSGNDWTRIDNASKLVTSRETSSRPPS
jgi:uncharacterized protein (DUF2147 family)